MFELTAPLIYSIELTNWCQNRCPGCCNVFSKDALANLGIETWKKILGNIKSHAIHIRLTGGEPTLHPEFHSIIDLLEKNEIYYSVFTNGQWENSNYIIEPLREKKYFINFLISLHGADHKTNQSFNPCLTHEQFEKIISNIKEAAQFFSVDLNCVLHKKNWGQIEKMLELKNNLKIKNMVFSRYIGKNMPNLTITEGELKSAIKKIKSLSNSQNIFLGDCVPQCFIENNSGCTAGYSYATVDPLGNLRPCNHSSLMLGNLLKDSIENIWKNPKRLHWLKNKVSADCYKCKKYHVCFGGCKAQAELLGLKCDPLKKKYIKKERTHCIKAKLLPEYIPIPLYYIKKEKKGFLLINRIKYLPVSHNAKLLLEFINGENNLLSIKKRFGAKALEFIYYLFLNDFIEFKELQSICPNLNNRGEENLCSINQSLI